MKLGVFSGGFPFAVFSGGGGFLGVQKKICMAGQGWGGTEGGLGLFLYSSMQCKRACVLPGAPFHWAPGRQMFLLCSM